MNEVRFGVLGAARIAPAAIIKPAAKFDGARVVSVAARDRQRAERFAAKHRIPSVHDDYRAVVEGDDVDAIYIPLPNSLHAEWTIAALEAGKHVLCEKPWTSNAAEAEHVADIAGKHPDLVEMEAFHYRYHPLAVRMREIVDSGELGTLRHVEASLCFPLPRFGDIRYNYGLAGGATMDAGCYTIHMVRLLGREEPEVVSATPTLRAPDIDRAMTADLRFPSGHTGRITCSMWSRRLLVLGCRAVGDAGELRVLNPIAPHLFHRLTVRTREGRRVERVKGAHTYDHQLEAFCAAVGGDASRNLTPPVDSIATMRVIDAVYTAAGLPLR